VELIVAHYAFLDETGTVVEVIVGRDETDGVDWEQYYAGVRGLPCKRTSYNTLGGQHLAGGSPYRGNYAGVGYSYNEQLDAFIPPCPGEGWTIDEATFSWVPVA
jgi:hypothetical protein